MLIEIPQPELIIIGVISFIIGLLGLYSYYKFSPLIKRKENELQISQLARLEHYEKQLIDMKIRLDSMEMQELGGKTGQNMEKQYLEEERSNTKYLEEKSIKPSAKIANNSLKPNNRMPNLDQNNAMDYLLQLITDRDMTSRDIQITIQRSREHTSRLMKKLFDDGYVERKTNTKPYTYSITKKGREKINQSTSITT